MSSPFTLVTHRLRCRSLRSLVTVVQSSSAVTQQTAGAAVVPVVAVSKGKSMPRQATASKQQQQAKVTFHKNRRSKHAMPVPSEPPPQCVPASLAQFAGCRALVLDSSYRPIDIVNWQRAICMDLFDKVSRTWYYRLWLHAHAVQVVHHVLRAAAIPAPCAMLAVATEDVETAFCASPRRWMCLSTLRTCQCAARGSRTSSRQCAGSGSMLRCVKVVWARRDGILKLLSILSIHISRLVILNSRSLACVHPPCSAASNMAAACIVAQHARGRDEM